MTVYDKFLEKALSDHLGNCEILNSFSYSEVYGKDQPNFNSTDKYHNALVKLDFDRSNILYVNKFDCEFFIMKNNQTENFIEVTEREIDRLMERYQGSVYELDIQDCKPENYTYVYRS